jgi:hypothetical protein
MPIRRKSEADSEVGERTWTDFRIACAVKALRALQQEGKSFNSHTERQFISTVNKVQGRIRQEPKSESLVRMSRSRESCSHRNSTCQLSQLTKEDKSIEVMSKMQTQLRQELTSLNQARR